MSAFVCAVFLVLSPECVHGMLPYEPTTAASTLHVIAADDNANNADASQAGASDQRAGIAPMSNEQDQLGYLLVGAAIFLPVAAVGLLLFIWFGLHRLDRAPPQMRAFSIPVGVAMFIASWALSIIGAVAARELLGIDTSLPLELDDTAMLGFGRYVAEGLIVATFAFLVWRARGSREGRPMRVPMAIVLGLGALALFWFFAICAALIVNIVLHLMRIAPEQIAHMVLAQLIESERDVWFYAMCVIVIVVAPIVEEVIYRGILQNMIGRLSESRWFGIFGASAIFAVMHIAAAPSVESLPGMMASLFIVAVGFGWAYEKSGRLIVPIIMHMLFNAGNVGIAMLVLWYHSRLT